jgi:hypothetical protein
MMKIERNKTVSGKPHPFGAFSRSLIAAPFLALALAGCLQDAAEPVKGIGFSGFPASVSATPSSPAKVSGTIEAGKGLDSVVVNLSDPDGNAAARNKLATSGKTSYQVDAMQFSFAASSCDGTYRADFVAYSGSESKTQSVDIALSGAKDCDVIPDPTLAITSLTMGAQENPTLGSSIDLDVPKVLLSSAARTAAADVDLVYANSFADDADKLWSPNTAKDNVDFMTGWSVYNSTRFHKVTGVTFASVNTAAELAALWKPSLAITTGIVVVPGDLVIAETDKGKLVLLDIVSQTAGETGSINIKVAK